jgi:hypothetical protein
MFIRSQKGFSAKGFVSELDALEQIPNSGRNPASASQKRAGRFAARPLCGNLLWRLAFGLRLDFCSNASNSEQTLCEKTLLRPHQMCCMSMLLRYLYARNAICWNVFPWIHELLRLECDTAWFKDPVRLQCDLIYLVLYIQISHTSNQHRSNTSITSKPWNRQLVSMLAVQWRISGSVGCHFLALWGVSPNKRRWNLCPKRPYYGTVVA